MAKETTLAEYAALADNTYHKTGLEHELPAHIVLEPIVVDLANADKDFHAEVYRNTATDELIVAVRGTNGLGDVGDWPEAAVGIDTEQTPASQKFIEEVVYFANEKYPGASLTPESVTSIRLSI